MEVSDLLAVRVHAKSMGDPSGVKSSSWWTTESIKTGLAILGGMWVVVQVYSWVTTPTPDVVASIRGVEYRIPPPVQDSLGTFRQLTRGNESDTSGVSLLRLASSTFSDLDGSRRYWTVSITNEGSRAANEVTLRLPQECYAIITRDGENQRTDLSTTKLTLGQLLPQERINIEIWSLTRQYVWVSENAFTLTFAEGVGRLQFYSPVGVVAQWIDRNLYLILTFLITLLFIFLTLFIWKSERKSKPALKVSEKEQ